MIKPTGLHWTRRTKESKGLVRTMCLKEEDQGGGKGGSGEEFHFG